MSKMTVEKPSDFELVFIRSFKAPRALVWKAHVDPDRVKQWWGPEGFSTTTHHMQVKVGGQWSHIMHGPDGTDYPNLISYLEVTEPSRLVYDHGDANNPQFFRVVTDFIEEGQGTKLVTRMTFKTKEERDNTAKFAVEGHGSTMDRLEKLLEKA